MLEKDCGETERKESTVYTRRRTRQGEDLSALGGARNREEDKEDKLVRVHTLNCGFLGLPTTKRAIWREITTHTNLRKKSS